jgi:hypothetical protein
MKGTRDPSSSRDAADDLAPGASREEVAHGFVQAKGAGALDPSRVQRAADAGTRGSGGPLPHGDRIQAAFGPYDVSGVRAHVGGEAGAAAAAMGATAFATGESVGFRSAPDLHTSTHEATHVVQQRAGVSLKGGVGQAGDAYERHADAVADKVVAGESAVDLLAEMAPSPGAGGASVQRREVQRDDEETTEGTGSIVDQIKEKLSYGAFDWAITDEEATGVLTTLAGLSGAKLRATLAALGQTYKTRLLDNLPASARATSAFTKVLCAMGPRAIEPYIEDLLSYGIFDWAITDAEVAIIFEIFKQLPVAQAVKLYDRLSENFRSRFRANMARGANLTQEMRQVLWVLVNSKAVQISEAKELFKIRFRHELKDTSSGGKKASWTLENVRRVWQQLDVLPDADVSENQIWQTIDAIKGGGGFYVGGGTPHIEIGQGASAAKMAHTVRHEIGHGVHRAIASEVDAWLDGSIDFKTEDWDTFISDLGGFPAKYTHPTEGEKTLDDAAKSTIKTMIDSFTGSGKWAPTRATPDAGQSDADKAMWAAMPEAVKNGCAQSTAYWYDNYANFQTAGGRSYFLNHWYHTPYAFGSVAKVAIAATGDNYSAMSHKEFFANCYAEYFEDPEGINDNAKWGGSLPESVKLFFKTCVLERHPYSEFEKAEAATTTAASSSGDSAAGSGGAGAAGAGG